MRFPFNLRYLHEKPLPRLPLWNPGNPQPRTFMPLYWIRVVEPRKPLPNNFVKFECHWQMNSCDVKQYLEKLYNVSSVDVRIEIEKGKYIKNPRRGNSLSPPMPDQKFAYVQLKDVKFEYPKLLDNKAATKFEEEMKTIEKMQNQKRNKDAHRLDIGAWFA